MHPSYYYLVTTLFATQIFRGKTTDPSIHKKKNVATKLKRAPLFKGYVLLDAKRVKTLMRKKMTKSTLKLDEKLDKM